MHALSIKQPWATLLIHGLKTIEVRRWSSERRGRILIHAARVADKRPEAWELVPSELVDATHLRGGIVGVGDLIGCKAYRDPQGFAADESAHRNRPSWFKEPVLYGFTFANVTSLPFQPCAGWVRFFPVDDVPTPSLPTRSVSEGPRPPALALPTSEQRPGLLVSVRSAAEAEIALAGGAHLIDIKEPANGSLGPAPLSIIRAVIDRVAARCPVSATLGEMREVVLPSEPLGLHYVKWGLAACYGHRDWQLEWLAKAEQLQRVTPGCQVVAVAYADWILARAPTIGEVVQFARAHRCSALLLDTWQKNGKTLLDWILPSEVVRLCQECQKAGVKVALAGSLGPEEILTLRDAQPDWFAVRSAVCAGRNREGGLDPEAIRRLSDLVTGLSVTSPRCES